MVITKQYEYKGGIGSFQRLILEPQPEGTYIFMFSSEDSKFPARDELADNLNTAFEICFDDYSIPQESWLEIESVSYSRS